MKRDPDEPVTSIPVMKRDPDGPLTNAVAATAEMRSHTAGRPVSGGSAPPRPPVKRRLFAVGGATQPRRVRLTVGTVGGGSATTTSPSRASAGGEQPLVVRTQRPHKTFQRVRRQAGGARCGPEPAVWIKVGDRQVLDYKIPMGHQRAVMASELCDLDTKQTVLVRSAVADSSAGFTELDYNRIEWQPSYSQCYTPPTHCLGASPPASAAVQPDGDHCRSWNSAAPPLPPPPPPPPSSLPPPLAQAPLQAGRPDGDASSLMWLLDYRLDHLLEPAHDDGCCQESAQPPPAAQRRRESSRPRQPSGPLWCHAPAQGTWSVANDAKVGHDYKAAHVVQQPDYYATTTTKPPFTYTELIEQAMVEEGELTVSGIYRWITNHFAFYKSCDDRWKNSVRHNLSMNPYFRKGDKAKNGTGHLWMLANVEGRRTRRTSVAARMGRLCHKASATSDQLELDLCDDIPSPANDIWLSSAADNKENMPISGEYSIEYLDYVPDEVAAPPTFTLEESADRILSGPNNQVEVQYITTVRPDRIAQDSVLVDYQHLDVAMQS